MKLPVVHTLDEVRALLAEHGTLYMRWGNPRRERGDFRSRNHSTGAFEPGMSVVPIRADMSNATIWGALIEYEFCLAKGCVGYLATGTVVGRGSDGEHCIGSVVPVARIGPALTIQYGNAFYHQLRMAAAEDRAWTVERLARMTDAIAIRQSHEEIAHYDAILAAADVEEIFSIENRWRRGLSR